MRTKRGLSDVVTTVLIILLVLAAVVIIWTFVRPAIEGGISQVGSECFEMDLSVVECTNVASGADTGVNVIIERGSADISYQDVVLVLENDGGQVSVMEGDDADLGTIPNVLGKQKYVIEGATGLTGAPTLARVTANVQTAAGETQLCNPTGVKVACA